MAYKQHDINITHENEGFTSLILEIHSSRDTKQTIMKF